jgi:hypothetical protein
VLEGLAEGRDALSGEVRAELSPRVELLQLFQSAASYRPDPIGRSAEHRVMEHDRISVASGVQVELNRVGACL